MYNIQQLSYCLPQKVSQQTVTPKKNSTTTAITDLAEIIINQIDNKQFASTIFLEILNKVKQRKVTATYGQLKILPKTVF